MLDFPGFDKRVAEIQAQHGPGLEVAGCMFSAWMNRPIDHWLFDSCLSGEVLGLTYILNIQACRQFRSAVEECRKGQGENAAVLARCLFETVLAAYFILAEEFNIVAVPKLGKPPNRVPLEGKWVARARNANDTGQPLSREQRALIYRAHCYTQSFNLAMAIAKRHLEATGEDLTSENIQKLHTDAKDRIGVEWSYIQSEHPHTYSGLTLRSLAEVAGYWFPTWYEAMYPDQSRNVHSADPIAYVKVDLTTYEVEPRWLSQDFTIKQALYCANVLFLAFTSCLNENIGLGNTTEMLLDGFLEDLRKIYGPNAAVG